MNMYRKTGGASKQQTKSTGERGVLSDIKMLENSCELPSKPCNNNSSSCDSSDDEPVVKRPRKTTRRVIDPSKILSSHHSPANVYTTVAKRSFEEIHAAKLDFSEYCREETEKIQKEEEQKSKKLKKNSSSEIEEDLILIENECCPQDSDQDSLSLRCQSPAPPSPPPPVTTQPGRRTRADLKIRQNLNKIQSSIKKIGNALNSETCDSQCLDDSLIILDDINVLEESLDTSVENFSREIVVMVKIGSQIKRFPMNNTDTFCNLFSFLSEEKEVPESRLMLLLQEKTIHQNETPTSIELQVADIIDCLIMEEGDQEELSERTGPNVISLVIQSSLHHKSKKTMQIGKFEMLQGIIDMYAKQNKLQAADLKLRFDGEIVNTSQTPNDLDMEDEDCLDLIMA